MNRFKFDAIIKCPYIFPAENGDETKWMDVRIRDVTVYPDYEVGFSESDIHRAIRVFNESAKQQTLEYFDKEFCTHECGWYQCVPNKILQNTDLLDVNGNEIYEWDFVDCNLSADVAISTISGQVVYNQGGFCIRIGTNKLSCMYVNIRDVINIKIKELQ